MSVVLWIGRHVPSPETASGVLWIPSLVWLLAELRVNRSHLHKLPEQVTVTGSPGLHHSSQGVGLGGKWGLLGNQKTSCLARNPNKGKQMHGLCIGIRLKQPETFPSVFGVPSSGDANISASALSCTVSGSVLSLLASVTHSCGSLDTSLTCGHLRATLPVCSSQVFFALPELWLPTTLSGRVILYLTKHCGYSRLQIPYHFVFEPLAWLLRARTWWRQVTYWWWRQRLICQ